MTDANAAFTGRPSDPGFDLENFQAGDPPMQSCLELARVAARTDLPILILGETGTGKTLLARAIHNSSRRADRPFVAFNAAALSETLLDSQLFGHERGAFTGAERRVKGKFELADQGTLFIDEIADMSNAAQAKILRAVEQGEFERLGSESLLAADVRLISATHLPINRYLAADRFRLDLFYRIAGITLRVPPLRERPTDLPHLIAGEIAAAGAIEEKEIIGLSREAADILMDYDWPGNLRELKRVIHTAVALAEERFIQAADVLLSGPALAETTGERPARPEPSRKGQDRSLRAAELRHIVSVLRETGGNKRRAAGLLGLSRSTLDRKLAEAERLGIEMRP